MELHPLLAQRKLVGVCLRKGVQCVGYSPLGHSKSDLLEHPTVQRVAAEAGRSPAQVRRGVAGRGGLLHCCPFISLFAALPALP